MHLNWATGNARFEYHHQTQQDEFRDNMLTRKILWLLHCLNVFPRPQKKKRRFYPRDPMISMQRLQTVSCHVLSGELQRCGADSDPNL